MADDLVGSKLFSGKRNNPFKMLNTNHRHYSASILMCSQVCLWLIRLTKNCQRPFEPI